MPNVPESACLGEDALQLAHHKASALPGQPQSVPAPHILLDLTYLTTNFFLVANTDFPRTSRRKDNEESVATKGR